MLHDVKRLLIAILIIVLGYVACEHILPHLGLRIGWEAGHFLISIIVVVSWLIGGIICFSIILNVWKALRHSPRKRRFGNYAILVTSVAIVLIASAFLCIIFWAAIGAPGL